MVSRKGRLVTKPITIEPKNTCPSFCDINFILFSFLIVNLSIISPSPSRSLLKR